MPGGRILRRGCGFDPPTLQQRRATHQKEVPAQTRAHAWRVGSTRGLEFSSSAQASARGAGFGATRIGIHVGLGVWTKRHPRVAETAYAAPQKFLLRHQSAIEHRDSDRPQLRAAHG